MLTLVPLRRERHGDRRRPRPHPPQQPRLSILSAFHLGVERGRLWALNASWDQLDELRAKRAALICACRGREFATGVVYGALAVLDEIDGCSFVPA